MSTYKTVIISAKVNCEEIKYIVVVIVVVVVFVVTRWLRSIFMIFSSFKGWEIHLCIKQ